MYAIVNISGKQFKASEGMKVRVPKQNGEQGSSLTFNEVLLLNDDFTPMDFVVYVLKEIFNHADQKAHQIMLKVHNEGEASCGIFTKDVAETKSFEVNNLAKINDHPLISIVKPNYD